MLKGLSQTPNNTLKMAANIGTEIKVFYILVFISRLKNAYWLLLLIIVETMISVCLSNYFNFCLFYITYLHFVKFFH